MFTFIPLLQDPSVNKGLVCTFKSLLLITADNEGLVNSFKSFLLMTANNEGLLFDFKLESNSTSFTHSFGLKALLES